jgi:hypothetical protein
MWEKCAGNKLVYTILFQAHFYYIIYYIYYIIQHFKSLNQNVWEKIPCNTNYINLLLSHFVGLVYK